MSDIDENMNFLPYGWRFMGNIVDGEPSGEGVYYDSDGNREEGNFIDGKLTG